MVVPPPGPPLVRTKIVSNDFIAKTNCIKKSGIAIGNIKGNKMFENLWNTFAPSTEAASKTSEGKL